MKSISLNDVSFKKPRNIKIVANDFNGVEYNKCICFFSCHELIMSLTTLVVFGFVDINSIKLYASSSKDASSGINQFYDINIKFRLV